jgi:hypothetical protein
MNSTLDYTTKDGNLLFTMLTTRDEIEDYYREMYPMLNEEIITRLALEEILLRVATAKKLRDLEVLQAAKSFAF